MSTLSFPISYYQIRQSSVLVLRDSPKELYDLKFHLANGDYLALVGTIIGYALEAVQTGEIKGREQQLLMQLLQKTRRDLITLHATHRITPK